MSNFIQIPNKIQDITSNAKTKEIYAYGLIRGQIKDNSYTASITEKDLAKLGGWCEKTSWNYVQDLEKVGLIHIIEKKKGKGDHRYNVYKFPKLDKDYSIYSPSFFQIQVWTLIRRG